MSSCCGGSDHIGDECGDSEATHRERYVNGWAVAPRLREEMVLSKLKSRLAAAASKHVPGPPHPPSIVR
jgi:hypothetical protein